MIRDIYVIWLCLICLWQVYTYVKKKKMLRATMRIPSSLVIELVRAQSIYDALTARVRTPRYART